VARDPVCGMEVEPRAAEHATVYEGKPFFFCAAGCEKAFDADPQKYVDPDYRTSMPGL